MQYIFFGLAILQIPVIYTYSTGTAYKSPSDLFLGGYDYYMLGNMGYSSVNCDSSPVDVGFIGMQCNYGVIGEIFDYGLHERNDEDTYEMCINDERMKPCKPKNPIFLKDLNAAIGKDQHYLPFKMKTMYANPASHPDRCFASETNNIFVQYTCVQSQEQLSTKYN